MEELYDFTVSLITCSPGSEVWANYGHTALRIQDRSSGTDVTFNYGLFSFDTPHFIWRFCTGQTDYCVGASETKYFLQEYERENRQVTEQVLDLPQQDKLMLWSSLVENCRPENRFYRYNFFYDNCATRVRMMVERSSSSAVRYDFDSPYSNLRDILNHYTADYAWTGFGISMLLGPEADSPASLRVQMFAPEIMQQAFAGATVDGRPLVSGTSVLVPAGDRAPKAWIPSPQLTLWTVAVLVAAFSAYGVARKKRLWGIDLALSLVLGLMGSIIFFLTAFSSHPATSPNWLLIWINPLPLAYGILMCFGKWRESRAARWCSALYLLPLSVGLAGFALKFQYFHPALIPLLLTVALRCGYNAFSIVRKA